MDIGVDSFVANITTGFASPNKYNVLFRHPKKGHDQSISMMCNVANIPGRSLQTYENRHYGVPFKLPYTAQYDDITFSFITQIGFKERKFFESWQELVIEPDTGLLKFYDDYVGDIIVWHLDGQTGERDYAIKIIDAWPISIAEIPMGSSMTNETLISSIAFTYRNWESIYSR